MVMAGAIVAPILPAIITGLQIDPSLGSSLVSLHFITVAIATPLLGMVADRCGQRRLLLISLFAYALVGMAGGLMQQIWPLLILRGLLGIASGGVIAAGLGLVGKLYQGDTRTQVIGYVATTITLANIIYPLLGGALGLLNWRWTFALYGVGIPLAFWVRLRVRLPAVANAVESTEDPNATNVAALNNTQNIRQLLTQLPTLGLLISLSLSTGTVYAVIAYLPLYLKTTIGAGMLVSGMLLAVQAIGAAVISAVGMRALVGRFGNLGSIGLGLGVMGTMLILLPNLQQLFLIGIVAIVFGMGFGIVMPNLYDALAKVAPAELQSSILATGTGAGFLGQFLSPIVLGIVLAHLGLPGVFYTAATINLLVGMMILASRHG